MVSLKEKILEYYNKGYYEFRFSDRGEVFGYTINIEARKGGGRVELTYNPKEDKCIERIDENVE